MLLRSRLCRARDSLSFGAVSRAALRACAVAAVGKTLSALAHPADALSRDAYYERVRRYVAGHHAARADEGIFSERHAADDRSVCSDRAAAPDEGFPVFGFPRHMTARIDDVGEHHRRTAENVVLDLDAFVDRNVVLDLHVVSDAHAVHDDDILPEGAPLADDCPAEHVTEMPDFRVGADLCAVIYVRRFVNERAGHLRSDPVLEDRVPFLQGENRRWPRARRCDRVARGFCGG